MKLPTGTYYVGDPCYVYPKDRWIEFCNKLLDKDGNATETNWLFNEDGKDYFVCSTAFGDGVYPVFHNGKQIGDCGVDAGLLSIIPFELIKAWGTYDRAVRDGVAVELKGAEITYNGGDFTMGKLHVITSE